MIGHEDKFNVFFSLELYFIINNSIIKYEYFEWWGGGGINSLEIAAVSKSVTVKCMRNC